MSEKIIQLAFAHKEALKRIQSLEMQIEILKECLISIQNVDGMQLDEKEYCFKKESIEVHRLIENTLEQINKMEKMK